MYSADATDETMTSEGVLDRKVVVDGLSVSVKPAIDKDTGQQKPTDIFVAWGRQANREKPISGQALLMYFDTIADQVVYWRTLKV